MYTGILTRRGAVLTALREKSSRPLNIIKPNRTDSPSRVVAARTGGGAGRVLTQQTSRRFLQNKHLHHIIDPFGLFSRVLYALYKIAPAALTDKFSVVENEPSARVGLNGIAVDFNALPDRMVAVGVHIAL